MTLKCPKCGSNAVIFLSTTDGTAVGSTDQRYKCKDCGYAGSLILDDDKVHTGTMRAFDPRDWLTLGVQLSGALLIAVVIGLLLGDTLATIIMVCIAFFVVFLVRFMSIDRSEAELQKDLKKLTKEIK